MDKDLVKIKIDKLVFGGQGMGVLTDGRKCFVWGALPKEEVLVKVTKNKKDWVEANLKEIIKPSPDRVDPKEPKIYLATSPWQILDYPKEVVYKQSILQEAFKREGVEVEWQDFYQPPEPYFYRNKMEFSFWWDNDSHKINLALHARGSHQKVPVTGSALASIAINETAQKLIYFLNRQKIQARMLKSVVIRSSQTGQVGISMFITDKEIATQLLSFEHKNGPFEIIYSSSKSPASIVSEILSQKGDEYLTDNLLGQDFKYKTRSFFQVNVDVYQTTLKEIASFIKPKYGVLDLFCGVGSIGLCVAKPNQGLILVESDSTSAETAKYNASGRKHCLVISAKSEEALDYISQNQTVIVDPPRVGLHEKLMHKLENVGPARIIYLSGNPSTQARDLKRLLAGGYEITSARGYNFFPANSPYREFNRAR